MPTSRIYGTQPVFACARRLRSGGEAAATRSPEAERRERIASAAVCGAVVYLLHLAPRPNQGLPEADRSPEADPSPEAER